MCVRSAGFHFKTTKMTRKCCCAAHQPHPSVSSMVWIRIWKVQLLGCSHQLRQIWIPEMTFSSSWLGGSCGKCLLAKQLCCNIVTLQNNMWRFSRSNFTVCEVAINWKQNVVLVFHHSGDSEVSPRLRVSIDHGEQQQAAEVPSI